MSQEEKESSKGSRSVNKGLIVAIIVLSLVLITGGAYAGGYYYLNDNLAPVGLKVAGCEVGSLAEDEIVEKLKASLPTDIELTADNFSLAMKLEDLGISPDFTAAAQQAVQEGHGFNIAAAYLEREKAKDGELDLPLSFSVNDDKWAAAIEKLRAELEKPAIPAQVVIAGSGQLEIVKEVTGKKLLADELLAEIEEAYRCGSHQVALPVVEDVPDLTASKIKDWGLDNELAEFSTNYASSSVSRKQNVRTASEKISGVILQPGAEFSFNQTVGKRTVEEGFREAPVYKDGKLDKGIGGGICQVSTTLYNAALLSGMEIVERSNHSMLVHYVAPGRDATVDYGSKDLRFKNPYDKPVYLLMVANGSTLRAAVFGAGDGRTFKVVAQTHGTIPFKEIIKTVNSPSEMGENQKGGVGAVASATRIVYRDGVEIERQNLGTSKYAPMHRIKYVLAGSTEDGGSGPVPETPPAPDPEPAPGPEPVANPLTDSPV